MVKLRSAFYCNLKWFLLLLVVLGHWIEPQIWTDSGLYTLYRWIYLVHMPLFSFLSGLFIRSPRDCLRQLKRTVPAYLLCQGIAVCFGMPWHTPFWHLWYLLSLSCWLVIGWILLGWNRGKWGILALSVLLGCLSGLVPWIGRPWSVSRTIVFFPWFWLGVCCRADFPWWKLRIPGLLGLMLVLLRNPSMSVVTLYQAAPCDPWLRLECYAIAALLGTFLLSWCPRRRLPVTWMGADTMPVYLLHAPLVLLLRPLHWSCSILLIFIISYALRWHGTLYGIRGKEECPWPDLKNSTRPMAGRSTGSSCV